MKRYRLNHTIYLLFGILCLSRVLSLSAMNSHLLFTPIDTSQGLSDNRIRYIFQLPDGRMVFTTSGSINLYDGSQFSSLHYTSDDVYPLKLYQGFYHLYLSDDSLLWVKDHQRLMCINLRQAEYIMDLNTFFQRQGIKQMVEDLFVDKQGRIYFVSNGELIQPETEFRLLLPTKQKKLQDLMAENDRLYLFYDTGEMDCHDLTDGKLLYHTSAYPQNEISKFENTSLVIRGKTGFYQLRNGIKSGLFHFDLTNKSWSKLMEQDYVLNTILETSDDRLYITCTRGFWIIHPSTGTRQYLPTIKTRKGDMLSTELSTVFEDRQGGLWLGTYNRGLLYYHPTTCPLIRIGREAFPVSDDQDVAISRFAEDKAGNIYLREHDTLYKLERQNNKYPIITPVNPTLLPSDIRERLVPSLPVYYRGKKYNTLYRDSRGWLWAGSSDGLELYTDTISNVFRRFYHENGLNNNFIQSIIEDKQHMLWVTTGRGISRIQIQSKEEGIQFNIITLGPQEGTLEGEYMAEAAYEGSDGTLYFGGVDGFNIYPPQEYTAMRKNGSSDKQIFLPPKLPFPPIFTALYLHGEKIEPNVSYGDRIILKEVPAYTKKLELNYDQNFLTFEFSALNYCHPLHTNYRYRLQGIDTRWNNVAVERTDKGILRASYTNLPPGSYQLEVTASPDVHSHQEGESTYIEIIIHAPWWKTKTAYIVYFLFSLLSVLVGIQLYIRHAKKEMERRHKEDILLLRIKNLIEQRDQYEAAQQTCDEETESQKPSAPDSAFLTRAIELVEKNLHVTGYSVEQLSRDLCMERTGLYRKLVTLLDQSPTLFIRNIRLQRAAKFILEGQLTITEIAERTGFCSTSYLSKCFQEMYGCRPSEYALRNKKST
ncbi:two-component regulator propeller domain-containing protein [Bacteroides finegoldii]|uniref:two-component regulator propeller domain-containing protein n=1 Tax=Bacteroides finegoldii TaxID=338188 RepID=UPI00189D36DA|nr:two-component regulator propeller domain-containing protein [Bacteroides finegoldii]